MNDAAATSVSTFAAERIFSETFLGALHLSLEDGARLLLLPVASEPSEDDFHDIPSRHGGKKLFSNPIPVREVLGATYSFSFFSINHTI
jgi:hypothetical protein